MSPIIIRIESHLLTVNLLPFNLNAKIIFELAFFVKLSWSLASPGQG
jgi:hypothetical protein